MPLKLNNKYKKILNIRDQSHSFFIEIVLDVFVFIFSLKSSFFGKSSKTFYLNCVQS